MTNNQAIIEYIKANLGKDLNETWNELGCAKTVNNIFKNVLGYVVGGDVSTAKMLEEVVNNPNFIEITTPNTIVGDIILSATGTGNGTIAHGHVGVLGENGVIYSNNSAKDMLDDHLTAETWKSYFTIKGGFKPRYFRAIGQSKIKLEEPIKEKEIIKEIPEEPKIEIPVTDATNQDDNRPFYKSASKLVFLSFGLGATILLYSGKITSENWMILASGVFGYYFKNTNTSK